MSKKISKNTPESGKKFTDNKSDRVNRARNARGSAVDSIGRVARTASVRGPLFSEAREGYTQRWVNDTYHNIDRALERGWRPRLPDTVSAEDIDDANMFDNCISRVVNRDGTRAVLMEMPTDVYKALEAEKQKEVDAIEEQIVPEQGYLRKDITN